MLIVAICLWVVVILLVVATELRYVKQVEAVDVAPSATVELIIETPQPVATVVPTPQPTPEIENYDYVVRVVMAESGNQSLEGQMAVAQCIANTAEAEGMTLYEVVTQPGQYADPYPGQPNASVEDACTRVFKNGERVVEDAIRWFYNPSRGYSAWHESKIYVTTIGAHKFFA